MRVPPVLRRLLTEPVLRRRALVVALTGLLSPLPLVGTFGYESSVALTAPFSLLGIGAGVDAVRAARAQTPPGSSPSWIERVGSAMLVDVLGLSALALAVLVVAQLWNPTCDPLEGLAFFVLGPVLSGVLGGVGGLWGGTVVRRDARRRQLLAGFVPMLFCFVLGVHRIYGDPVVFALDPFWGYFAGPLYDEAVSVNTRYLWFRAYNVAVASSAVLALHLWTLGDGTEGRLSQVRARPWSFAALLGLLALSGSFGFRAGHHHFTATVDSLSHELPGTLKTEHFEIHYAPNSRAARELDLIEAEHEFAWHRLATKIGQEPEAPVHSFVFPDPRRKRVLMGAGRTEVAPPWRGHLYLNDQRFPHRVLHHELAHAFSAPLGDPVFGSAGEFGLGGVKINLALVEGFAEALAPRPRNGLDLHDQATVLHQLGKRPPLASLMGLSFWGKSSRHAYAAAGSFSLWLLETRGVERLVALYQSAGDFPESYGVSLDELEAEWVQFLDQRPIRERDIEAQRQRYKKKAIFQRPCAHRSANLQQEARSARSRGDHQTSLASLETLCSIEPQRTQHRITLAQAQAEAQRFEEAWQTLEQAAADPEITHTLASSIDQRMGDLALRNGDLETARAHYRAALERSVSEPIARALQIREIGTHDPRLASLLVEYFAPFESDSNRASMVALRTYIAMQIRDEGPHAPLGSYLLGVQMLAAQQGARAAEAFERALAPEADEKPLEAAELRRAARVGLLNASVRIRDYARAREVLALVLDDPEIGNGHRYTFGLWAERIEFFETYRPAGEP